MSTSLHLLLPWGLACLACQKPWFPPGELSVLERTTRSLLAGSPFPPSTPRNVSVSNPSQGRNVAACQGPRSYFGGSFASPRLWPAGHPWSWLLRASLPDALTTPSPPPAKKKHKAEGLRAKFKLAQSLNLGLSHPQSCPGLLSPFPGLTPFSSPQLQGLGGVLTR